MNRAVLLKHLHDVRETLVQIGRSRHGSFGLSAMDLKKVLDQTVRELKREVNKKVLKVPEIEIKVCEATSNEPWGPHGTIMGDIAHATRNFQEYHLIMGVLWKRLHDSGKNWRHVYKSLTVMEYLIANGAERVIDELREQAYQIQALLDFQYIEPNGKDQGINVQKKAQSMLALINDRGKIRELRQKAAANRDKYRGLSSTGMTFKPSSYFSTGGSYGDNRDKEQTYGGGSNVSAQKNEDGNKDLECRSQRAESNRDDCSCGEREHNEFCASSKGGDPNSDKGSSTEGDGSRDIDEYRQYSRAPGNRGVVAAVIRAQTTLSHQSSAGPASQQLPPRKSGRDLSFTINPAADDNVDDFDPRRTAKCPVPASKDESTGMQSQQHALEDLFADVEFQASYPPISAPPPASTSALESDCFQTSYAFSQASKPNCVIPPPPPLFSPAFPRTNDDTGRLIDENSFVDSFNASFASFDESPKPGVPNGGSNSDYNNVSAHDEKQQFLGSSAATTDHDDPAFFGSFNPFSTKDHSIDGNNQAQEEPPHRNPFLSSTTASAFWDDPLITSLVDLSIGTGPKQDHNNAPLSMSNMAAASSSVVSRAISLPVGATTFSMARHMNSSMGPGRSVSDLPKSN